VSVATRRLVLLGSAGLALTACAQKPLATYVQTIKEPGAGESLPHIQRLAVWLVGDGYNFDKGVLELSFKAKLGPKGVEVSIGQSKAYEFKESDAEKAFVASTRSTHRLDIKVVSREAMPVGMAAAPTVGAIIIDSAVRAAATKDKRQATIALYSGDAPTPLWEGATMSFGPIGRSSEAADALVNVLVRGWEKAGLL
jgi:hypothetical protein